MTKPTIKIHEYWLHVRDGTTDEYYRKLAKEKPWRKEGPPRRALPSARCSRCDAPNPHVTLWRGRWFMECCGQQLTPAGTQDVEALVLDEAGI